MTRYLPNVDLHAAKNLNKKGVVKIGTVVKNQEILVGIVGSKSIKTDLANILSTFLGEPTLQDLSLRVPVTLSGVITKVNISRKKQKKPFEFMHVNGELIDLHPDATDYYIVSATVYITEKRTIQVGDKVAGRHGNKGIIAKILPYVDMPYLPDGTPVDMILNPLGIPSRMNVGQIFEGLLNMAALNLNERYSMQPFDEMQQYKSSQIFVYKRLNEARKKTRKSWLFNPNYPGKATVFNGRNGKPFDQKVSIGFAYILKLIHLVKDKIHARLTGPYTSVVQQPLKGRSKKGGQRFGEMEVWAMEGFGSAYSLQELMTIKSDDVTSRSKVLDSLIKGKSLPKPTIPEAFKVFVLELQSLCFDLTIFTKNYKSFR